ncbi:L-rhamnose-1-dehydrogenase 1 [Colletotrichum chlorophyti]|uniref:L-rhamnose-1-dehydrogenase 1 n=1 Tax=Colletotrichum chlorophyti TaxID=708187 RepID=A0A1Q8RYZ9_9PEZI|nr:L-rhamnose-1-dehydrogenase 1 [Colletotrichum chlorophyti]
MASSSWRLLKGKTACITGGTTGIGRAITLEYIRQGANVAVNHLGLSRDEQHKASLLEEAEKIRSTATKESPAGQLIELAGDVTNPETGKALVGAAVKKWGGLDILVANAGIFKAAEFLTLEKEVFDKSMQVNVNGAFYTCQAAANQMVKQGRGGSIIGISSISALVGGGLQTHYTPTKAAVLSMIQSMAIALAKHRIRCNALLPGTIHTQLAEEDMQNEQKRKYLEQRIPMGVGKPGDLAGPAVFLACEELNVGGPDEAVARGMVANEVSIIQHESPDQDALCTGVTPHASAQTSSSYGANLENATAIWVDLLLQDAAMQEFDFSNVNFAADGVDPFVSSVVQSPAVGRGPPKSTGDGLSPTPCTSNAYLHERTAVLNEYQKLEKQAWRSATSLPIAPHEHAIFQNFVQHISTWMRNIGLMNAILALSTRHLSLSVSSDGKQGQNLNDALRYYYKTLHYIQEAMQYDTYKTSLELLATCSIVSAYEMLDGSRQDWERHLKGVFWIQRSQVIHGDSMGLKQAVWWAWLCQDVWAAFREKRRPFTFWRPLRKLDELDPYELAARSVYFFAQVVAYCSHEETEAGKNDPIARVSAAETLKEMLENWRKHLTTEFQPLPYASSTENVFEPIWIHPPAFGALHEAVAFQLYYCSHILLLLHVPVLGGLEQYTQQRKRLMECVKKVCGIGMTLSDYPSSVLCSQCLFIGTLSPFSMSDGTSGLTCAAGIPLENTKERRCVLDLLEACRNRSGWPVKPLGEELRMRWEASEASQ